MATRVKKPTKIELAKKTLAVKNSACGPLARTTVRSFDRPPGAKRQSSLRSEGLGETKARAVKPV
jgi:hypothetical protein